MFIELLNNINKQHVLSINLDATIPKTHERLLYIVEYLKRKEEEETTNISSTLIKALEKVLGLVGVFKKDMDKAIKKFKNFLLISIDNYTKTIMTYIDENSSFNKRDKRLIAEFISTLTKFNVIENDTSVTEKEATDLKAIGFIKNCLYYSIHEFPNIIINSVDYSSINIHKHWGLSEKHKSDVKTFVKKNYELLKQFYEDSDLIPLLNEIEDFNRGY